MELGVVCVVSVRTFSVMYDYTFLNLRITRSNNRPHIKFSSFPQGFVWVCMGGHTHFYHPRGGSVKLKITRIASTLLGLKSNYFLVKMH